MGDRKPGSWLRSLASVGPGIVVAGSVIGSGELVNTPVQAAKFGFVLLWAVLLACVIKVFAQIELARHCMVHDRTTIEALNEIPGPKWRGTSWTGLVYMLVYFASMMPIIGIIGLLGELMHSVWPLASTPETSARIWSVIMALVTLGLLWQGWYDNLEKLVMLLVGGFSLSVGAGIFLIQGTSHRISSNEFLSGLVFSLGENSQAAAFAVISLLGALGTAANELFMYPYWILEKGYARELGDPASDGWSKRARHWVNTIRLDVGLATGVATIVTAGFFLLGAAVLYRQGIEPKGWASSVKFRASIPSHTASGQSSFS
jgi:Mn2+/Fe2+ NRAMP family transporter